MHFLTFVILPPGDDEVTEDLSNAMAPWQEEIYNPETKDVTWNERGWWDWYQIGGRWTGVISGYDPETDPENYDSNRGEVKWPTRWIKHHGDVCYPADVLRKIGERGGGLGYTVLSGETLLQREIYHPDKDYPDCFEKVEDFDQQFVRILQVVHPESRVVVVDCHS